MKKVFLSLIVLNFSWIVAFTVHGNEKDPLCCYAYFSAKPVSERTIQFKDRSWSDSRIISYQWNFGDVTSGDKNISFQKNPVHEFTEPGVYSISLVIVSKTNCRDSVTRSVFVGSSNITVYLYGQVTNVDNGDPIAGQPVSINADMIQYSAIKTTDMNGFYRDTIYNAPSGIPIILSVFDCNDSLLAHTVYSTTSPIEVNFSICAPEPCKADFTSRLDSANQIPNTYAFTDVSFGNPDVWKWSFGDGEYSDDQNPIHIFKEPGIYQVCLKIIKRGLSGEILCTDSMCKEIVTPNYYNLGGLVFAGLYPINNPSNTGDTGVAYLYRLHNGKIIPHDTLNFTYLGYYAFLRLLEGSYIVKLGLKEGSAHYHDYLPAYTGDHLQWQSAEPVIIDGNSSYSNDVHLIKSIPFAGPGSIGGYVTNRTDGPLIKAAEVILFNADLEPVSFTFSDEAGRFEFLSIGYGKYFLNPDITGKYSRIVEVNINEQSPNADGILLEVSDVDYTGVEPGRMSKDLNVLVYPNPFSKEVNLKFASPRKEELIIEIVNFTGAVIHSSEISFAGGEVHFTLPLCEMPHGLYLLTIRSEDGACLFTKKIIRN